MAPVQRGAARGLDAVLRLDARVLMVETMKSQLEHCVWCSKPIMANDSFCVLYGRLAFHNNNRKPACVDEYQAWTHARASILER